MSQLSTCNEILINGTGKCSVPMWINGCPAGFCNEPAYSNRPKPPYYYIDGRGLRKRGDSLYDGYVPALACPIHGGKRKEDVLNLCQYCKQHPAECKSNPKFGNGEGNDNVYECDIFSPKSLEEK